MGAAAVVAGLAVLSERYTMQAPLVGGASLWCVCGVLSINHETPGDGPAPPVRFEFFDRWFDGIPDAPLGPSPRKEPSRWWRDRSGLFGVVWATPVVWYEWTQSIGSPFNGMTSRSLSVLLRPLAVAVFLAGAPLVWTGRRAARRARLGHCPACGYDRAGLGSGKACPECGRAAEGPREDEDSPKRR